MVANLHPLLIADDKIQLFYIFHRGLFDLIFTFPSLLFAAPPTALNLNQSQKTTRKHRKASGGITKRKKKGQEEELSAGNVSLKSSSP